MSAVKRRRTESEEVMDVDLIEQVAADAPASATSQSDSPWSGDRLPPEVVAAAAGDLKQLQKLLAGGGRIDAVGASGITPVYAASKAGHVEIVAFLVGKRAAVDVRVGVECPTALCAAADAGHLDVVKMLLAAGAQSDACSIDGVCPLVAAASRGHAEIVQTLLEGGEKAESAASRRQLALFAAMNDGPNTGSTAIVCSALLDAGVSVNEADSDGDTALHCAALAGKVECAQLLLAANADAAARHDDGWTPLHSAASQGHTPVAQLLLKAAASPKKMFSGESCDKDPVLAPLSVAIENGNVETATALIAAEEAGLLHASGALSLMCAVRQGDLTMARLVLECGNDVDATTPELPGGATALAIGIEGLPRAQPPTAALVKFLIEAGADVSIEYNLLPPNEGVKTTPLHRVAAVFPDAELTRLLLDAGAGVNALNSSGATPLCVAAARPDSSPEVVAMVRTLVAAGANVCYTQVADEKGESPLFMAVNHAPTPDIAEMVEVMAAADPRAVGLAATDGTTPLIMACQNAKDSLPATVVEALLKCQADVSQPSTVTGSTAMHITAYMGNPSVLEVLMAAGAPVDQPNHEGITPLYWATRNGHPRAVKVLLEAGADATQTFSLGHPWSTSLLQEPVCKDNTEVLALLIAANTDPNTTSGRILEPPLFRAAAEGSERAAQVLIAAGADIEKTTTGPNPETPLAVAVDCGYENLAGMLVAAGANFKTLDFPDYLSMMFQAYRRYCVRDGAMFLRTLGKDSLLPETERLQLDAMSTIRQTKTDPAESILTQRQSLNSSAFCDKLSQTLKVATQLDRLDLVEIMLANGAPVDQPDTDGITPLVEACRRGHLGIARCLVAAGATVNPDDLTATASGGSTPLLAACKRGHTEVARLLLDHGASVRPPPPTNSPIIGFTPLHAAARGGDVATVALLLTADASPTAAFLPSGTTPIHAAAEHGHAEVVAMLLKAGGEVDACRADGATALSLAARVLVHPFAAMDCAATSPAVFVPDHTTVNTVSSAQVLLEAGADVGSVTSDDSSTPLHFAALRGHLAMAEILVKAGANVNARRTDLESTTALSLAARYGHTAVVSLLLEHGATVDDSLALFHAAQAGQTDVYQLLVQHGADPSITRASDGESPQSIAARSVAANTANASPQEEGENTSALFQAVAEGDVNSVHRLLEDGANANAVSSDGVTVLSAAAEVRDTAIMFALLGSGADVNLCSEHGGHTALHHAAHSGCGANVPLLLAANANCDSAAGAQGETPLMMASKSGAVDVTELLLERGVSINAIKSQGGTALMQASTIGICGSHFNKRFAVRVLATHGADVDAADSDGKTALHVAIEECNVGTVDELLQAQANVDHVSASGDFPLLLASRYGVSDILRLVLAADADVNRQGPRGETSLYAAVAEAISPDKDRGVAGRFDSRKYMKSVQLLLCHGADPNIPAWHSSSQSRTALQLACEHNRNDLVSLLLDVGADPSARVHPTEQTALHLAIATGGVDVVTSLLNATADVNARGADNVTPLVAAAAGNEEPDVFNALVAAGADVNARSPRLTPLTPLMLAVRRGWRDSVDQLLAQGADVNAKTRYNETALAMAVDSEDCECVEALVRAGAHVRTAHASTLITPLGSAVKTQQHRLADFLREVGAGPEKAPPSILCDGVMCPCGGRAVEGPRWHHDATGRNFCTAAYKALALAEAEGCTSAPLATETASLFVFLRGVAKSVA